MGSGFGMLCKRSTNSCLSQNAVFYFLRHEQASIVPAATLTQPSEQWDERHVPAILSLSNISHPLEINRTDRKEPHATLQTCSSLAHAAVGNATAAVYSGFNHQ